MASRGGVVLLDFTSQLDRTADVTTVQVKVWVKVLFSCDCRGVVRTGALRHVTLVEEIKIKSSSNDRNDDNAW